MAKRRKVGNMLGLAILSAVSMKPMHPYEMASVLRARGKDEDIKIKWGTLYTVVGNLEKHGFIVAAESVRHGGRPERTVYQITDAGRAEHLDWVRELTAVPEPEFPRFGAALSEIGVLGPDEAVRLLRQRVATMEAQMADRRATLAATDVPRLFLIEVEYDLAIREAEIMWVRSLLTQMTDGTMPGIEQWRAFHETGQMPPEFAEFAERGSTTD